MPSPRQEIARAIDPEEWRPVVDFDAYEVSNFGQVRRVKPSGKGRVPPYVIKPEMTNGYPKVTLKDSGRRMKLWVHRAVALAFLGDPPPGHEVAHRDGNGLNCHLSNLRWATKSENSLDRRVHGTVPKGKNHHWSKYTDEEIIAIKQEIVAGLSNIGIARKLGIPRQTANAIRHGRSLRYQWSHDHANA